MLCLCHVYVSRDKIATTPHFGKHRRCTAPHANACEIAERETAQCETAESETAQTHSTLGMRDTARGS